ncbi:c-type cytochrome domain-containing protein [Granulicella sp. WH15]|uniref:c-type cytochrome domain-containing protein n=1 Tax=Granulicella sp. WH15 TaxID=2602070 RepID=UPI002104A23C|nr:c-type cytochrome domain-containing protein [Granulicella sp. WH15]
MRVRVWGLCAGLGVAAIGLTSCGLAPSSAPAKAPVEVQDQTQGKSQIQPQTPSSDDAARPEFYLTRVKPIFAANCARCHGGMNHRGGLNMDSRAGMMRGGHDGVILVPGDPGRSTLVKLMRHEGPANDPRPMPPNKPRMSDADIAIVERWIKAGAVMPEDVRKP